ncbi:hypothetical protein D320_18562, partial [Haloferax sp. BAB-2207]
MLGCRRDRGRLLVVERDERPEDAPAALWEREHAAERTAVVGDGVDAGADVLGVDCVRAVGRGERRRPVERRQRVVGV